MESSIEKRGAHPVLKVSAGFKRVIEVEVNLREALASSETRTLVLVPYVANLSAKSLIDEKVEGLDKL